MSFVFDPGLVLYLPLYELDGASFASKDAYRHLCTVTGALWRPQGRYLDGLDDRVLCGTVGIPANGPATIEWWNNLDSVGTTKRYPFGDFLYFIDNANKWLYFHGINAAFTFHVPNTKTWYYLVLTYSGQVSTAKLSVDGGVPRSISNWGAEVDIPAFLGTIGKSSYSFHGLIGEVRVYNRVLTPLEIQHNYLATKWRYR